MSHTEYGNGHSAALFNPNGEPRRFRPDIAPQKAQGLRLQQFRFHTEPIPQKNPEALAPGFFFTLYINKEIRPVPLCRATRVRLNALVIGSMDVGRAGGLRKGKKRGIFLCPEFSPPRILHIRRSLPARWLGPVRGKGAGSLRPRSSPSCAWRIRHG